MSRLILIFLLIAGLVAAASLIASAFGRRPASAALPAPMRGTSLLQKVSFSLLIVVMIGVATGWLGAD